MRMICKTPPNYSITLSITLKPTPSMDLSKPSKQITWRQSVVSPASPNSIDGYLKRAEEIPKSLRNSLDTGIDLSQQIQRFTKIHRIFMF